MQYPRNVPREAHRAHHLRGRPSPASSSSLASSFTRFYLRDTPRRSVPRISPGKGVIIFNSIGRRRFFIAVKLQVATRQSRAYSVGSRPEIRGRKMATVNHDQVPTAVPAAPPPSACTGYTTIQL
jgi:hypothetical protein